MELFIYVVFLGVWFRINYKRYKFNGASFLIFIYFISALAGIYLVNATDLYDPNRLNITAVLFHCLCLYLFLYPIVYITNKHALFFSLPKGRVLKGIYYIIISLSALTFISILPKIKQIFSLRDLKTARIMNNQGTLEFEKSGGVLEYLGAFGSVFSFFAMYLAFYNLIRFPERKKIIIILFLCSTADAITSLSMVGRGGIVRWLLMLLFFYFTFREYINSKLRKSIIKTAGILSLPLLAIFYLITVSRFSDRSHSVFLSVIDYLGQPFVYFSYIFDSFFDSTFGGRMNFPFLFPDSRLERSVSDLIYTDFRINTFSTFIGSFYKDIGFVMTLSIAFCFWLLFIIMVKYNKKPRAFYKFVLYIVFSQIIINGVFYFQYTGTTKMRGFIVLVILSILAPLLFPYAFKKKHN